MIKKIKIKILCFFLKRKEEIAKLYIEKMQAIDQDSWAAPKGENLYERAKEFVLLCKKFEVTAEHIKKLIRFNLHTKTSGKGHGREIAYIPKTVMAAEKYLMRFGSIENKNSLLVNLTALNSYSDIAERWDITEGLTKPIQPGEGFWDFKNKVREEFWYEKWFGGGFSLVQTEIPGHLSN